MRCCGHVCVPSATVPGAHGHRCVPNGRKPAGVQSEPSGAIHALRAWVPRWDVTGHRFRRGGRQSDAPFAHKIDRKPSRIKPPLRSGTRYPSTRSTSARWWTDFPGVGAGARDCSRCHRGSERVCPLCRHAAGWQRCPRAVLPSRWRQAKVEASAPSGGGQR